MLILQTRRELMRFREVLTTKTMHDLMNKIYSIRVTLDSKDDFLKFQNLKLNQLLIKNF